MAVIEEALEDLHPTFDASHTNLKALREDAVRFFERGEYKRWARAAGMSYGKVEEAYLAQRGEDS